MGLLTSIFKKTNQNNMNTETIVSAVVENTVIRTQELRGMKYTYGTKELITEVLKTLVGSLEQLVDNYYISIRRKRYDSKTDTFSDQHQYGSIYSRKAWIEQSYGLTEERMTKIINGLSKKGKKRINRLLVKLKLQPTNTYRLTKLWNKLELVGGNHNYIEIGNRIEDTIGKKRQAYKEVIKYIKLDLEAELAKTRQEYRDAKGDYFKKKK